MRGEKNLRLRKIHTNFGCQHSMAAAPRKAGPDRMRKGLLTIPSHVPRMFISPGSELKIFTALSPSLDRDDELAAGVIGGETGQAVDAGG